MIYESVIHRERNMEYNGKCVEVVPHITNEIINRLKNVAQKSKSQFVMVEIGGTVGEYQNLIYFEAARILKLKYPKDVLFFLVSYLPIITSLGEMKTKPTQHAVRLLNSYGLQPDFILARSEKPLDNLRKEKLAIFCNVKKSNIISAPDVQFIYEIPVNFEKEKIGNQLLKELGLKSKKADLKKWINAVSKIKKLKKEIKIGIVGKYFNTGDFTLADSYISVIEAIKHAAWSLNYKPILTWLNAEDYEKNPEKIEEIKKFNGIIVPGGFGKRGVDGKINAIKFCRINKIPYFGLCYGMQLAIVEFARNVLGLKDANTTEVNPKTKYPVIDFLPEQYENIKKSQYGGTMRLGNYKCHLKPQTIAFEAYKKNLIIERHRHRYEFNNKFKEKFEKGGMIFSGINPERNLIEIVELNKKEHPFFVGVQFHPEFKSRFLIPHPLFREFIKAAIKQP